MHRRQGRLPPDGGPPHFRRGRKAPPHPRRYSCEARGKTGQRPRQRLLPCPRNARTARCSPWPLPLFLRRLPGRTPGPPPDSSPHRRAAPRQCRPHPVLLQLLQWSLPAWFFLASFPRTRLAGALFVHPVRQSRRSAHFLILQLILPRFCAKRYTRRAVFPHLPKCLWKKRSKMAGTFSLYLIL